MGFRVLVVTLNVQYTRNRQQQYSVFLFLEFIQVRPVDSLGIAAADFYMLDAFPNQ